MTMNFSIHCPFCAFVFDGDDLFLSHMKTVHSGKLQSPCYCKHEECFGSFSNIYAYKKHCHRVHRVSSGVSSKLALLQSKNNSNIAAIKVTTNPNTSKQSKDENVSINSSHTADKSSGDVVHSSATKKSSSSDVSTTHPTENKSIQDFSNTVCKNAALVVADLYSQPGIPRSFVNSMIEKFSNFYNQTCLQMIEKKIETHQPKNSSEILSTIEIVKNCFTNLDTEYKAFQLFSDHGFLITSHSVPIDATLKSPKKQKLSLGTVKQVTIEIIPMKAVLKKFLELPGVFESIISFMDSHGESDEIGCFLQGSLWRGMKQKFENKIVFPLVLYFDEVNINNVLGTHKNQQKMAGVYYFIASLPPEYQSQLENILIAQIHNGKHHKNSEGKIQNNLIFTSLMDQFRDLENEGIKITINGDEKQVYFALALIIGDNLGLNTILGLTCSFTNSQCCRICSAEASQIHTQATENGNILRTKLNYEKDVECEINGIKERCILNELSYFHCIENSSLDKTHDFDEGGNRYVMGFILTQLIKTKKYFSLDTLNLRLKFFHKDTSIVNAPIEIPESAIKKSYLTLSASEMTYFVFNFAFLIGDLVQVGDEVWRLYILLRQINCMVSSRTVTKELCNYLRINICEHQKLYLALSGKNLPPKLHY